MIRLNTIQLSCLIFALITSLTVFAQGPIAYYPFNGNALDESGNNNDGVFNGGVTLTADRFGNSNGAYSFNGTDGFISGSSSQFPTGTESRTVSGWVQGSTMTLGIVIEYGSDIQSGNTFGIGKNSDGSSKFNGNIVVLDGAPNSDESWRHIAATYDGTTTRLFENGIEIRTSSSLNLNTATGDFKIGGDGVNSRYLNGKVDDIRVYDRVLSPTEISDLYTSEKSFLVAYYPFNGNSNDESSNGYNGTVNSALLTTDRFGNANSAYSFNGVSQYIDLGTIPYNAIQNVITMAVWVKAGIQGAGTILSRGQGFRLDKRAGDVINFGTFGLTNDIMVSTTIVNDNLWHFIVGTYDGSTKSLYIDGILETQVSNVTGTAGEATLATFIGNDAAADSFFAGNIDDVRLYNRALSATEITGLYTLASGIPNITSFAPTSGPIGTLVTITGTNFDATPANNIVFFGATQASVTSATATELTVTVPAGATYQPVSVSVNGLIGYASKPFNVTFPTKGPFDDNSFGTYIDLPSGPNPYDTKIHDLDGDGKPDILFLDRVGNILSVIRNVSTGGISIGEFEAKIDFATGNSPYVIAIEDIDGDGQADIAVTNRSASTISLYKNQSTPGNISLASKVDITAGSLPQGIALFDVDGDGKPDLISSNNGGSTVSVYRNKRTDGVIDLNTFDAKVDFATGAGPEGLAVDDVDGDGKPEIVVANRTDNTISILKNTSLPGIIDLSSFASKVDFSVDTGPSVVGLIDLDGDGKLEVVTANPGAATFSILLNTSTPGSISASSFDPTINYSNNSYCSDIAFGDFDGNDQLDFGTVSCGIYENISSLGSITSSSFPRSARICTGTQPSGIAIGDLNADGKPDLVITDRTDGKISIIPNAMISAKTETDITAFSFPEQTSAGIVDAVNYTIDIEVASGTNLATLISTFTLSTGATATVGTTAQVSGTTTNNFTNPVTYTVTAEDGVTTQDWVVTVVQAPSSATDLTTFSFTEETGPATIGTGTVVIEVTNSADITNLIASFNLSTGATAMVGATAQVSGATANDFTNPVTYTVTAENGTTAQDWVVTVTVQPEDLANPEISAAVLPTLFEAGSAGAEASIDVTDNVGLASVSFFSRKLNIANFSEQILTSATDTYSVTLTENQVSDIGLEYFFYAIDGNQNDVSTDTIQILIQYTNATSPPIPTLGSGGRAQDWRMFSIPFDLENDAIAAIIEPVLGPYNVENWRLFHWQNGDFAEYTKGLTRIDRGKGYWFNSRERVTTPVGAGIAPANTNDNLAVITLASGWNQIGNPYAFDVSWNDVLALNNITTEVESNLRIFNGSSLANTTTLNAFGGAYLKASQNITLEIPLVPGAGGRFSNIFNFEDGWLLNIDLESGLFSNKVTAIGMHTEAEGGNDRFDQIRAPRFASYIDASFAHPEYFLPEFSRDIVKTQENFAWEFTVSTNIENELRLLSWQSLELDEDLKLTLIDQTNGNVIDMLATTSYSYAKDNTRKFKIIYGDEAFLLNQFENANSYLGTNYPNPFNSSTTIPYTIHGRENEFKVKINIYSISGALVKTLVDTTIPSGIYSAEWDGSDASGNSLSGMFIYSLDVQTAQGVQVQRKKMIVR